MAGNSSRLRWSKELAPRPNCNAIQFFSLVLDEQINCSFILYVIFRYYATTCFFLISIMLSTNSLLHTIACFLS